MSKPRPIMKLSDRDRERHLAAQYAQILKDTPPSTTVHKDCQEVIAASLELMHCYNKVALFMKQKIPFKPEKPPESE